MAGDSRTPRLSTARLFVISNFICAIVVGLNAAINHAVLGVQDLWIDGATFVFVNVTNAIVLWRFDHRTDQKS